MLQCQFSLIKLGCKLYWTRIFLHVWVTVSTVRLTFRHSCTIQKRAILVFWEGLLWARSSLFRFSLASVSGANCRFCCCRSASSLFYMIAMRLVTTSLKHIEIKLWNLFQKVLYFCWHNQCYVECKLKEMMEEKLEVSTFSSWSVWMTWKAVIDLLQSLWEIIWLDPKTGQFELCSSNKPAVSTGVEVRVTFCIKYLLCSCGCWS